MNQSITKYFSARKAMDEAKRKIMAFGNSLPLKFDVSGIGSFRNEVVFARVVPGPQLDLISRVAGRTKILLVQY